MKALILFLGALLAAAPADAQTFQVQTPVTVVCPSGSATQNGSTFTCAGSVPQCPSPPGPGPCTQPPAGSVNIGDLQFNGVQVDTNGVGPNTPCAYGKITMPTGVSGMSSSVVALVNGSSNAWKQVTLTKDICDFSVTTAPTFSQGQTATIFMSFVTPKAGSVTVLPGVVYYFNVRNQLPFGGKSCTAPDCNFAVRLYPPSN